MFSNFYHFISLFVLLASVKLLFIYFSVSTIWQDARTFNLLAVDGVNQQFNDFIKISKTKSLVSRNKKPHHRVCIPTLAEVNKNNSHIKDGVPDRFDWRQRGAVGSVFTQGYCKGCWAISIIESMESIAAIREIDTSLTPLSAQQLIDCSDYNNGCEGGNVEKALSFLCDTKIGITTAEEYPNTFENQDCKIINDGKRKIAEYWTHYNVDEEEILRLLIERGPLVAVVNCEPWIFYTGGVIQNSCVPDVQNHVIQIVGYDKLGNPPYYIVKNSWGENWGDNGYLKLALNIGICGINREVSYFNVI